jgi:hypothetical protein
MADKKPKVYFGCLPKEQVFVFIENLKKALAEEAKSDDKKTFEVEIRGTKEEPKGVSFETFSVTKDNYATFVDASKDYMGKALSVFSVSVNAKDEASVKVLEDLFAKMKPMFEQLDFVKKHPGKYEIHLRTAGKKVTVDFVSVTGEFLQPLLDLGLNVSDYHNFKASFKSEFLPDEFFNKPVEELTLKALQLLLSIKGNSVGVRQILSAVIKALKGVKLNNEKFQKKLDKHVEHLNALNAFLSFSLNFEFDAKELCGAGLEASKIALKGADINKLFGDFKTKIEGLFANMVKPILEQYQLVESAKATDVDEISISAVCPKYQNGIAHVVKLPGFSKAFSEKFLK